VPEEAVTRSLDGFGPVACRCVSVRPVSACVPCVRVHASCIRVRLFCGSFVFSISTVSYTDRGGCVCVRVLFGLFFVCVPSLYCLSSLYLFSALPSYFKSAIGSSVEVDEFIGKLFSRSQTIDVFRRQNLCDVSTVAGAMAVVKSSPRVIGCRGGRRLGHPESAVSSVGSVIVSMRVHLGSR
jgi:hypothetical protein